MPNANWNESPLPLKEKVAFEMEGQKRLQAQWSI